MSPTDVKEALAIRHVAFEDLGLFEPVLVERGVPVRYVEAADGLSDADALRPALVIVLGGPIGAYMDAVYPFLTQELRLLERRLAADRPTLGICLGAQLMARALGARVYPGPAKEIGFSPLRFPEENLLSPFGNLPVLHWHGDTFDLPQGALNLAATPLCAQQAFSFGKRALGFQFHPEAQPAGFERWLIGHAAEIAATPGISVPGLRTQMLAHGAKAAAAGSEIFARWLKGLS